MSYLLPPLQGDFVTSWGQATILSTRPSLIVPNNPERCYLGVGNFSGSTVLMTIDPNVSAAGALYTLAGNGGNRELIWADHSILCTLPWYGLSTNVSCTVFWVQVLWRPTQSSL